MRLFTPTSPVTLAVRHFRFVVLLSFVVSLLTPALLVAESRSWKYLNELSEEERQHIDLRTETPRDATLPYLPAESYPFTPPYTAEEIGFRIMEFPHMARWNHVQIEDFGSIMPTGYLSSGKIIVLAIHDQQLHHAMLLQGVRD